MNRLRILLFVFLGFTLLLTSSFDYDPVWDESDYTAVLMTRSELEKSIAFQPARPISQIGKIYKKGSWVFITEKYKGIHLIDNTNPAAPVKSGFIRVPGCVDIAMKNNTLFAENSVDLISIDINMLPEIRIAGRVRDIFPEQLPPDLVYIPHKYTKNMRPANTLIVEWKKNR